VSSSVPAPIRREVADNWGIGARIEAYRRARVKAVFAALMSLLCVARKQGKLIVL
jgi:hypothetical protein